MTLRYLTPEVVGFKMRDGQFVISSDEEMNKYTGRWSSTTSFLVFGHNGRNCLREGITTLSTVLFISSIHIVFGFRSVYEHELA